MAVPVAALAKLAAAALSDEDTRRQLGWIVAAICSPLILTLALICSLLSGSAEHNSSAVLLCFNGSAVCDGNFSDEDLCSFLSFCRPHNLEISGEKRMLEGYKAVKRVMFGFTVPKGFIAEEIAKQVFSVL